MTMITEEDDEEGMHDDAVHILSGIGELQITAGGGVNIEQQLQSDRGEQEQDQNKSNSRMGLLKRGNSSLVDGNRTRELAYHSQSSSSPDQSPEKDSTTSISSEQFLATTTPVRRTQPLIPQVPPLVPAKPSQQSRGELKKDIHLVREQLMQLFDQMKSNQDTFERELRSKKCNQSAPKKAIPGIP